MKSLIIPTLLFLVLNLFAVVESDEDSYIYAGSCSKADSCCTLSMMNSRSFDLCCLAFRCCPLCKVVTDQKTCGKPVKKCKKSKGGCKPKCGDDEEVVSSKKKLCSKGRKRTSCKCCIKKVVHKEEIKTTNECPLDAVHECCAHGYGTFAFEMCAAAKKCRPLCYFHGCYYDHDIIQFGKIVASFPDQCHNLTCKDASPPVIVSVPIPGCTCGDSPTCPPPPPTHTHPPPPTTAPGSGNGCSEMLPPRPSDSHCLIGDTWIPNGQTIVSVCGIVLFRCAQGIPILVATPVQFDPVTILTCLDIAMCHIYDDSHITTSDSVAYDMPGKCSYTMAQQYGLRADGMWGAKNSRVSIKYGDCPLDATKVAVNVSCIEEVTLHAGKCSTINVKVNSPNLDTMVNQGVAIVTEGVFVAASTHMLGMKLTLLGKKLAVMLSPDFMVIVYAHDVKIIANPLNKNSAFGMCGTWNNVPNDDLIKRPLTGLAPSVPSPTADLEEFATAWTEPGSCSAVEALPMPILAEYTFTVQCKDNVFIKIGAFGIYVYSSANSALYLAVHNQGIWDPYGNHITWSNQILEESCGKDLQACINGGMTVANCYIYLKGLYL